MTYAPGLPIHQILPDLTRALASEGRAVLQAPPGAGKTTLVPLALLQAPWLGTGKILMLEPRRLAARAAARRMAALRLLEKVRSPESYRSVDEEHTTRKRRSGGLPLDEAREFFKSHNSRLLNLDKAILSDEEKGLIDIRRANIRKAGKMYISLQQQALGITPPRKDRGHSL